MEKYSIKKVLYFFYLLHIIILELSSRALDKKKVAFIGGST
jgi:hypothetical protein